MPEDPGLWHLPRGGQWHKDMWSDVLTMSTEGVLPSMEWLDNRTITTWSVSAPAPPPDNAVAEVGAGSSSSRAAAPPEAADVRPKKRPH